MMKTYQLFWGVYLQWTKKFSSDADAVTEAEKSMLDETDWRLIRLEVVIKR